RADSKKRDSGSIMRRRQVLSRTERYRVMGSESPLEERRTRKPGAPPCSLFLVPCFSVRRRRPAVEVGVQMPVGVSMMLHDHHHVVEAFEPGARRLAGD